MATCGVLITELLAQYLPGRPFTLADGVPTFDPPLSAADQVIANDLVSMAKAPFTREMTLAEYQNIKPFLASEVTWQAITRNAFVNMAEADMRRAVYDIITAEVRVARAMRRD